MSSHYSLKNLVETRLLFLMHDVNDWSSQWPHELTKFLEQISNMDITAHFPVFISKTYRTDLCLEIRRWCWWLLRKVWLRSNSLTAHFSLFQILNQNLIEF